MLNLGIRGRIKPIEFELPAEKPKIGANMFTEFLLIAVTSFVLYNLIRTTEKTLARREQHVEKDVRIIDHRSRM